MNDLIEPIVSVLALIVFSLIMRFVLELCKQSWITTFSHTVTIVFLPVITFFVTKVISGDIALSLGMVGALSIVRFRNPVRSPLELSVYFGAITMGIAASVSFKWLILFIGAVTLVSLVLYLSNKIYLKLFHKSFFTTSFSEGNMMSTLTVVSKSELNELNSNEALTSKTINNEQTTYVLASSDFKKLRDLEMSIKINQQVISSQLNK